MTAAFSSALSIAQRRSLDGNLMLSPTSAAPLTLKLPRRSSLNNNSWISLAALRALIDWVATMNST